MTSLELLAPARTTEIGTAAVDCGADAVYIAGPAFGARQAAGNSVEDIARLCAYAHRFGVRIYATVNTILYEEELPAAKELVQALAAAGVDALIVQDPAVVELAAGTGLVLHASTQCAIRTPEKARFTESQGYGRLVLERQLSLEQIKAVREAVDAELEFFVHGALCVCYSGECYLSEYLTGRSANRGACAQACRSLYDLQDASGRVLARNKALLSLKDYHLLHRLEDLAGAGIQSFKIEGRLKGESYVRNVVRAYDQALNELVARYPDRYCRSSRGRVRGGFAPDVRKSFNRDFTELFLDGKRGKWSSMDAPKSIGEYVGTVTRITPDGLVLQPARPDLRFSNGDGFSFLGADGQIIGFRADLADGFTLRCRRPEELRTGTRLFRNLDAAFERTVESNKPVREISVRAEVVLEDGKLTATATAEDGRVANLTVPFSADPARNPEKTVDAIREQMGKRAGHYSFYVARIETGTVIPYLSAAFLNGVRRDLAAALDAQPVKMQPLRRGAVDASVMGPSALNYKANMANSLDRRFFSSRGVHEMEPAYELSHKPGAELMRSKYCVRYELGLCPRQKAGTKPDPLFLLNAGRRLRLDFHCKECEMTVTAAYNSKESNSSPS
ncbi:MAG: U32 family peptidase [Bacteroidales bacterium]|nr:U32 family peptidase [Bacteroidales bacterium]